VLGLPPEAHLFLLLLLLAAEDASMRPMLVVA
jgi:hypothetical protein